MVRQGAVIFFSGGDTDMEPLTGMSDTTLRFACMVLLALRACRLSEAGRGREMLCSLKQCQHCKPRMGVAKKVNPMVDYMKKKCIFAGNFIR